ncbi:MAG: RdgB/HAM1 family non-canonical purine NTP pyrophosphatase [Acidobacteria bacterium]|nr:RdgB/HAM1 family non-canonical purine NTP pyrophosphatase [Acidobacteriota bacterium]
MTTDPSRELLLATSNSGKVRELTQLLEGLPLRLRELSEFEPIQPVEETGVTFDENASLKATSYGRLTGLLTLADDSGLEVEALGGAPGVRSARYAGVDATDAQRVTRLLEELKGVTDDGRGARFVCVLALFDPSVAKLRSFRGVCAGRIATSARGSRGFGYDPVFVPEGYDLSFAQLPSEIKQQISHRARALSEARDHLKLHFGNVASRH